MAVPSLGQIKGENIEELINSLEKQRKELEYILSSLDAANILEISADLINSGTVAVDHMDLAEVNADIALLETRIGTLEGSSTGTDINSLKTRMTKAENDIDALEVRATTAETDINAVETRMTTAETDINAVETRMTTAETDINAVETRITTAESKFSKIDSVTSDPVGATVGQMWLRTDL